MMSKVGKSDNIDWSKIRIYLAGPIESVLEKNGNMSWRADLARSIRADVHPDITIWDPMVKPDYVEASTANSEAFRPDAFNPNTELDHKAVARTLHANKLARLWCQSLANSCDIMIARFPANAPTSGTFDELEIVIRRNIPILIWFPNGKPMYVYALSGIINEPSAIKHVVHYTKESLVSTLANLPAAMAIGVKGILAVHEWPNAYNE